MMFKRVFEEFQKVLQIESISETVKLVVGEVSVAAEDDKPKETAHMTPETSRIVDDLINLIQPVSPICVDSEEPVVELAEEVRFEEEIAEVVAMVKTVLKPETMSLVNQLIDQIQPEQAFSVKTTLKPETMRTIDDLIDQLQPEGKHTKRQGFFFIHSSPHL